MERNNFWIFLGILMAFGIAMGTMRDAGTDTRKIKRMTTRYQDIEDAGMIAGEDARAGRIEGALRPSVGDSGARAAGLAPAVLAAVPGAAKAAIAQAAAKTKKEDKQKKDDKKKKKKKKKKKTIDGTPADPATPDEDEEDAGPTTSGFENGSASGMTGAPAAPKRDNDIPQTQRDWETLVLNEPDFKAVEKLVKFYQSSMVSAEIFYNVVRQMVDDKRPKMRQLGLVALGATPSSQSFIELALFLQSERGGVNALKTQAQSYMQRYTELAYVRFLAGAMQASGSPYANMEAIRVFHLAIDRHLKDAQTRNPAEMGEGDPSAQIAAGEPAPDDATAVKKKALDVTSYFRPFVPILERLQADYDNRDLKAAAQSALGALHGLLPATAPTDQPTALQENPGSTTPPPATMRGGR